MVYKSEKMYKIILELCNIVADVIYNTYTVQHFVNIVLFVICKLLNVIDGEESGTMNPGFQGIWSVKFKIEICGVAIYNEVCEGNAYYKSLHSEKRINKINKRNIRKMHFAICKGIGFEGCNLLLKPTKWC